GQRDPLQPAHEPVDPRFSAQQSRPPTDDSGRRLRTDPQPTPRGARGVGGDHHALVGARAEGSVSRYLDHAPGPDPVRFESLTAAPYFAPLLLLLLRNTAPKESPVMAIITCQ